MQVILYNVLLQLHMCDNCLQFLKVLFRLSLIFTD